MDGSHLGMTACHTEGVKPFSALLLALLLTACAPSPEVAYTTAIQEALDRHVADCQQHPKPWCVGSVKVTRVYEVQPYTNFPPRMSEARAARFDAESASGRKDNGVAYIGNENGHWTVYAASSAHFELFNFDPSR